MRSIILHRPDNSVINRRIMWPLWLLIGNILAVIGFLTAILYSFMKYKHTYWKKRGISSPPTHWFFGNLKETFLLKTSAALNFGKLYHKATENDDVYGIYIFHKPVLILRNPELIKQIFIRDFHLFSNHHFSMKSTSDQIGSSNLFALSDSKWKYLRTKLSPTSANGRIKKLFSLTVETANIMEEHLHELFTHGSKTKTMLVRELYMKYGTDVLSSVTFGIRTNSFVTPPPEFYTQSFEPLKLSLVRALQFLCQFYFPQFGQHTGATLLGKATNHFRQVFSDSLNTRKESEIQRGDLLDALLKVKNENGMSEFEFDDDALLGQSAIFFLAGRESNVTMMSYTLYQLAKHPEIQKQTREEILQKLRTDGTTFESVQSMKYLFQVLSETLRMYPPSSLVDRMASVDYKLPGTDIVIEKGTPLYAPLFGLHYDPRYFKNPSTFDPDRFSDERKHEIPRCAYLPFGDGPRMCIGMRMGLFQSAVGVMTVLKDYEVTVCPLACYDIETRNVFTTPRKDFKLDFTKLC